MTISGCFNRCGKAARNRTDRVRTEHLQSSHPVFSSPAASSKISRDRWGQHSAPLAGSVCDHVSAKTKVTGSDHIETHGEKLFALAYKKDLEGIVEKRKYDPYIVGQAQWVKIRNTAYSQWEMAGEVVRARAGSRSGHLPVGCVREGVRGQAVSFQPCCMSMIVADYAIGESRDNVPEPLQTPWSERWSHPSLSSDCSASQ